MKLLLSFIFVLVLASNLQAQQSRNLTGDGHGEESWNMELVGHHDLQARAAYQPVIEKQGERWIAYVGLQGGKAINPLTGTVEWNGTMIVDVTDPSKPVSLAHIEGSEVRQSPDGSGAQMNRVCTMDGNSYLLRSFGSSGHEVWDVTAPREPALVLKVENELTSIHKNWWECETGIAYIVGTGNGWRGRHTRIYDMSDPAHPVFIRAYGVPGQQPGSTVDPVPTDLHGPIVLGDVVYFGYGSSREGLFQIVDRDSLLNGKPEPTVENLEAPEISRFYLAPNYGAHTTLPVLGIPVPDYADSSIGYVRDFLVVPSESTREECNEERDAVLFVDITYPDFPMSVSSYQVREADGNFCQRGGRFGPHAVDEAMYPDYYRKLVFVSYFNAGVRAVDIRDPFHPVELGYYIPATTANTVQSCVRRDPSIPCKTVIQTNNVEVDGRGLIYIVDRVNTGMHILQLTGEARDIAGAP